MMINSFFGIKEKAKAHEIGPVLLVFLDNIPNILDEYETITEVIQENGYNRHHILAELFFLRLYSIDFACYQILGNCQEKRIMLDAAYAHLIPMLNTLPFFKENFNENWIKQTLNINLPNNIIIDRSALILELNNTRLLAYSQIPANEMHKKIGFKFCEFLKLKESFLVMFGNIQFAVTVAGVSDFLKPFKIIS